MASVADFLIDRMANAGIRHVFGVPGDYVLGFYDKLSRSSKIKLINTTDEAHAGFAADAYARVNGIGCTCVTYSVGGLKLCNPIAGAFAEKSPVLVISGSPGMKERKENMILHHVAGSFESQREVFKHYTCASAFLSDPQTAGYEIDRVLDAVMYHKQPGYIELPRDIADKPLSYDAYQTGTPKSIQSDLENLEEALAEVKSWIERANRPVIIAGVEIARYNLGYTLMNFVEKTKIPVCTTLLSKSVVNENHPLFGGVYAGVASQEHTRKLVEDADCLLLFGVIVTDMAVSFNPKRFNRRNTVNCSVQGLKISNHSYQDVLFLDFCSKLFKTPITTAYQAVPVTFSNQRNIFEPTDNKITVAKFFDAINAMIDDNTAIVADIGDALFGASDVLITNSNHFLGPAFYTSMGFAIPAALGVQLAKQSIRPIVLVGDGAFQMSVSELSTLVQQGLNPIVFLLNNGGYTTERYLKEGSYNDIRNWNYCKVVELIGGGESFLVNTEIELTNAIAKATKNKTLSLIEVKLDKMDTSAALKRMTEGLSKRV